MPKHLNYMTQYTRDQMAGKDNPQRDMTNYKAKQKPLRHQLWLDRQKDKPSK